MMPVHFVHLGMGQGQTSIWFKTLVTLCSHQNSFWMFIPPKSMLEGWALILNHPPLKQMVDLQDILFDDGHLVAGDQYPIAILGVGSKCSRQDAEVVQTESDGQIAAISHYHAENPTAEQCQRHECGGLQTRAANASSQASLHFKQFLFTVAHAPWSSKEPWIMSPALAYLRVSHNAMLEALAPQKSIGHDCKTANICEKLVKTDSSGVLRQLRCCLWWQSRISWFPSSGWHLSSVHLLRRVPFRLEWGPSACTAHPRFQTWGELRRKRNYGQHSAQTKKCGDERMKNCGAPSNSSRETDSLSWIFPHQDLPTLLQIVRWCRPTCASNR